MTPVRGQHRTATYPGLRRAFVIHHPGASMVEVKSGQSMEHSRRWFRIWVPDGPSLLGCEASLASSSTFQSPGPTFGGRSGECDVVKAGSDPVVVRYSCFLTSKTIIIQAVSKDCTPGVLDNYNRLALSNSSSSVRFLLPFSHTLQAGDVRTERAFICVPSSPMQANEWTGPLGLDPMSQAKDLV